MLDAVNKRNINQETLSQVELYLTRARKECRDWHKKIEARRRLYSGNHYSTPPKSGEERYTDPTYENVVDLAIGIMMANGITWQASGWKPHSKEEEDSSHIEKFLVGLMSVNSDREESLIEHEALLHFIRDGVVVMYHVWDPDIAKKSVQTVDMVDPETNQVVPKQAFVEPPMVWQIIDPLKIFVLSGGNRRWLQIIRTEAMTILDAEVMYGVRVPEYSTYTAAQKMDKKIELVDYWRYVSVPNEDGGFDQTIEHAITLGNKVVILPLEKVDGYEELPFSIGFYNPMGKDESKDWTKGIIDPLETTISFLETSVNRRQHQITKYSGLPLITKSSRVIQIDAAIGNNIQLQPGEDVGFPMWQGNPPDVQEQIEFFRARAQQSGFSDVMFGGSNAVSGYAMSQLSDQNRIRLESPTQQYCHFWNMVARKSLSVVSKFGSGMIIRVYGRLRGEDFTDQIFSSDLANYQVRCLVKPKFPNEEVRKHAMATQVRGVLSNHTLMEKYLDIEQPDDERDRLLQEMAETDPAVLKYVIMDLLAQRAREGDIVAQKALQSMMNQSGSGSGQGQSKNPPNPLQAESGMMGANNGFPMSATGNPPPGQGEAAMSNQFAQMSPGMEGQI